jgi:hypothetical protein
MRPSAAHRRGDSAMIDATRIKEHMEVIGSDGKHVGRVDHVKEGEIELAKMDLGSGMKHHMIPMSWVDFIDDDRVRLNLDAEQARTSWREVH